MYHIAGNRMSRLIIMYSIQLDKKVGPKQSSPTHSLYVFVIVALGQSIFAAQLQTTKVSLYNKITQFMTSQDNHIIKQL